jgi:hypothetical protein
VALGRSITWHACWLPVIACPARPLGVAAGGLRDAVEVWLTCTNRWAHLGSNQGLLLVRRVIPVAGRGYASPGRDLTSHDCGWTWPAVAWRWCALAPRLAPRSFVSMAKVQPPSPVGKSDGRQFMHRACFRVRLEA